MEAQRTEAYNSFDKLREEKILETIIAYAGLDFSKKAFISDKGDAFDAIGAGVNMLGEELQSSALSLREKEQLLREIHHRVKNNLQIISSLLNLQCEKTKDERFLSLIRECRNRIKSMAIVHEMLYASKDLSRIPTKNYVRTLFESIYASYRLPNMDVALNLEIPEELSFEIDRMIELGLILNEAISNSLKYAFKTGQGKISISLNKVAGKYLLSIADNGKGLADGFDVNQHANMGMHLIFMLAEQIGGAAQLDGKNGTRYTIKF